MDLALVGSSLLLGLAGAPHCTAMCAAPCAAACGPALKGSLAFQAARTAGYALGGAVAAGSVGALASLSQISPALRPLWVLLHAGVLALGLWMLWQGRQPAWMTGLGHVPTLTTASGPWRPMASPLRAAVAGGLWVAWPCGLLQSALLLSSMTSGPAWGATAMAGFALTSSAGLMAGPWLWRQLGRGGRRAQAERKLVRLAGVLLVAASGLALGGGVFHQVAAYCGLT
jgi:sulfite exporter TauE/SafE